MKTFYQTKIQPILCSNIIEEKEQQVRHFLAKEEDYQEKIESLDTEIEEYVEICKKLNLDIKELHSRLTASDNLNLSLQMELSKYTKDDKHLTMEVFLDWLIDNVQPVNKAHRINADVGNKVYRNSLVRPSTFLRTCIKEEDKPEILKFAQDVLYYTKFDNEDDLIYKFNVKFDNKFPTRTYYRYDKVAYGYDEYWATPMQTINLIKTKGYYGDCDDISHLKFWCLTLLLDKYFPNWNKNRLRCFLNFVMGYEYHAMLAWVKDGVNDWIPIETTYFNERFINFWIQNMRLRTNQIGYKVNYSYDINSEYEKI